MVNEVKGDGGRKYVMMLAAHLEERWLSLRELHCTLTMGFRGLDCFQRTGGSPSLYETKVDNTRIGCASRSCQ